MHTNKKLVNGSFVIPNLKCYINMLESQFAETTTVRAQ